ncbi:MAG: DUF2069 domain-containing protein [Luteimonas sp.]|nr:DUF2069 domain-containing protein [Luteimonas sp.]
MLGARPPRLVLSALLLALAALYLWWFRGSAHFIAALIVFVLPVALLPGALAGSARAAFWAGVLGLLLFCHGVMIAWSEPAERMPALAATALSVALVFASSWPGLRTRFGRRK